MFYSASKLLTILLQPSSLCVLLITAGFVSMLRRPSARRGRTIAFCGLAALMLGGFSPLANIVVFPLEQRFAKPDIAKLTRPVRGIIILGGFEDGWVGEGRGELSLNEGAERFTEAVLLAKRLPASKVIFTGGPGEIRFSQGAANDIGRYLEAFGVARDRIMLEGASRTTFENAVLTHALVGPRAGDTWMLVTSAAHMPRAVGTFRKAGFDVIAYPVDYVTRDERDFTGTFSSLGDGLRRLDRSTKEWAGLVAYWLSGRSNALWPGP
jgi:uncharacterized SAM-binding protein YcdF (DUF218 family)